MVDKKQIKKNKLDLEYHGESQKANAYLILLTTGILAFLGTFIWLKDTKLFYSGIAFTLLVAVGGWVLYRKTSRRMKEILNEMDRL